MDPKQVTFAAATLRFALALLAATVMPIIYPAMAGHWPLFVGYAAVQGIVQFFIYKELGGQWRAFLGGVLDVALLTFIVQRVGSAHTMMVSFYFIVGIINALVVGPRMGMVLAAVAALMYACVVGAELGGVLTYAPDAAAWGPRLAPRPLDAIILVVLVAGLLMLTTSIAAVLIATIKKRNTQLTEANEQLAELIRQDSLTKLFNRRYILQHIEDGLAWLRRGRPMAVVMIDLDQFKRINDTQGHLQGDEVLRQIGSALKQCTRQIDVAGRYGGDEFVVVLPDTDLEQGRIAATRMVDAIRRVGERFDETRPVTASAGLSLAVQGDTVSSILARADQRAFAAKRQGGDRVCT